MSEKKETHKLYNSGMHVLFFLFFPLFTVTEKSMLKTKLRHQRPTAYLTCIEPHCEV